MLYSSLAIGNVFRRIRKRHLDRPSLRDAAEVIGITHQTLGSLENGSSHAWSKERIVKLCKFYGVTLDEFDAMCKAEDEFLDSTTKDLPGSQLSAEEEQRRQNFIKAATPAIERVLKLQDKLIDELPPKIYEAELNAIALKHGIEP